MKFTRKEKTFKNQTFNFDLFLYMLFKIERESVNLQYYDIISIFLKHPVHLKWYQFFWNTLYISKDTKFFDTR